MKNQFTPFMFGTSVPDQINPKDGKSEGGLVYYSEKNCITIVH